MYPSANERYGVQFPLRDTRYASMRKFDKYTHAIRSNLDSSNPVSALNMSPKAMKAMKAMKAYRTEPLYNATTIARYLQDSCGSRCRECKFDLDIDTANMVLKGKLPDSYIPDNWDEQIVDKQSQKRLDAAVRRGLAASRKAEKENEVKRKKLREKWKRNQLTRRTKVKDAVGEKGYKALTSQMRQDARLKKREGHVRQAPQRKPISESSSDSSKSSSGSS